MSRTKVNTATSADWSFMQNAEAVEAVSKAAAKGAVLFEDVEYEDAYHDCLLWLAVRPDLGSLKSGRWGQLAQDIYSNAIAKPANVRLRATETPFDEAFEGVTYV